MKNKFLWKTLTASPFCFKSKTSPSSFWPKNFSPNLKNKKTKNTNFKPNSFNSKKKSDSTAPKPTFIKANSQVLSKKFTKSKKTTSKPKTKPIQHSIKNFHGRKSSIIQRSSSKNSSIESSDKSWEMQLNLPKRVSSASINLKTDKLLTSPKKRWTVKIREQFHLQRNLELNLRTKNFNLNKIQPKDSTLSWIN
jgi:hypothetical protein